MDLLTFVSRIVEIVSGLFSIAEKIQKYIVDRKKDPSDARQQIDESNDSSSN